MSDVDFALLQKTVEQARDESIRTREKVVDLELQFDGLRDEVRNGFATLRHHDHAQHGDMQLVERRVSELELAVERINHAQGINAED